MSLLPRSDVLRRSVRCQKIITEYEQAIGSKVASGGRKELARIGAVHERLDGKRQVRLRSRRGKLQEVSLRELRPLSEPGPFTGSLSPAGLYTAQCHASALKCSLRREIEETRADATAK